MANEMIKIMDNNGENAVMGRELHEFLEVKTQYKDWIARMIIAADLEDGKDFCSKMSESNGGRPSKDHILTMDSAKSIAMLQHSDKGKMVRDYFIACERKLRALQIAKAVEAAQSVPALPASLTQELVELKRANKTLVQINAELAAKVQADHQILISIDSRMKNFASVMQSWAENVQATDAIDFSNPIEPKIEYRAMSKWLNAAPLKVNVYNRMMETAGYIQHTASGWRLTAHMPSFMAKEIKYNGMYQIKWSRKGICEIVAPTCKLNF